MSRPVHWENMVELKTEHVSVYSSIMEFVTMFSHVSRWDPAILNLLIYCRYQLGWKELNPIQLGGGSWEPNESDASREAWITNLPRYYRVIDIMSTCGQQSPDLVDWDRNLGKKWYQISSKKLSPFLVGHLLDFWPHNNNLLFVPQGFEKLHRSSPLRLIARDIGKK